MNKFEKQCTKNVVSCEMLLSVSDYAENYRKNYKGEDNGEKI